MIDANPTVQSKVITSHFTQARIISSKHDTPHKCRFTDDYTHPPMNYNTVEDRRAKYAFVFCKR